MTILDERAFEIMKTSQLKISFFTLSFLYYLFWLLLYAEESDKMEQHKMVNKKLDKMGNNSWNTLIKLLNTITYIKLLIGGFETFKEVS